MATHDPGTAPPKKGLSTGAKVLIGCLGVMVLAGVVLAVAIGVGGMALRSQFQDFTGGMEEQQEASEAMERLAEEHPFTPPDDGVVTEDQLDLFVAVTDQVWEDIRPWAEDLQQLARRSRERGEGGTSGLREMAGGLQAIGGFARARVQLAEALEEEGMSAGEYIWTGLNLHRAMEGLEGDRPAESVPDENLRLVERHRDRLPAFEDEDGEAGPGLVLAVATIWGMTDLSTWQAMGLDTLQTR